MAFLALLSNVLAPPGYMLSDSAAEPFAVVLCTAQGPLAISPDQGKSPAHKPHGDAPCAYAGHGVGAAPPANLALSDAELAVYRTDLAPQPTDLAPGRGLAAPPPPSRGPPFLL